MKTILLLLLPALSWSYPGPQINGNQINPQTGITVSTLTATGATGVTSGKFTASGTPGFTGDISGATGLPAATGLTGQVPIANGGTNLNSAGGTSNRVLRTSNGTTFAMGQVIGPDIAASTVAVSSLNQSGASDGQVISWSNANSKWQPTNAGVSGGAVGAVPVFNSATSLSPASFITSVSTGVAISTNATIGVSGSTGSFPGNNTFGGNNTFSGSNTFTGAVHISSGFVTNFTPSATFTSAQTSFTPSASVTGSTGTFTVQGSTVECQVTGRVGVSAGDQVNVGVGMDGRIDIVPGTSSTIGIGGGYSAASGVRVNIASSAQFQVTPGQHNFWMGLWGGGLTITLPDPTSIVQFRCREVPSR